MYQRTIVIVDQHDFRTKKIFALNLLITPTYSMIRNSILSSRIYFLFFILFKLVNKMKLLHRKKKHFFSTRWNRMISLFFFFYVAVCVLFFFSLRHTYAQLVCHKSYTEQYTMGFFFFFFFYITYLLITDRWINSCLCIR